MDPLILPVLLAFIAGYFISAWRQKPLSRRALLPPGPPGNFLFGNLRDMPTSQEWHRYTELARQYGTVSTQLFQVNHPDSIACRTDLLHETVTRGDRRIERPATRC